MLSNPLLSNTQPVDLDTIFNDQLFTEPLDTAANSADLDLKVLKAKLLEAMDALIQINPTLGSMESEDSLPQIMQSLPIASYTMQAHVPQSGGIYLQDIYERRFKEFGNK